MNPKARWHHLLYQHAYLGNPHTRSEICIVSPRAWWTWLPGARCRFFYRHSSSALWVEATSSAELHRATGGAS